MTRNHNRVLALATVLFFLSCGTHAAEVLVGATGEMTGPVADYGRSVMRGSQLGADWLNSRGDMSGNTIKLLTEDDGSDKVQALTLLNKFALRDNVSIVVGPSTSALAASVAPRAEELKIPMITIAYSSSVVEGRPWVFKSTDTLAHEFKEIGNFTTSVLKPRTCSRVWVRDNEAYVQNAKIWGDAVKEKGVRLFDDSSVLLSDTDFSAASTKIVNQTPDCVYIALSPEASANFLQQLKSAGLPASTKIVGGTTMSTAYFMKAAGSASEGVYALSEYSPGGVNNLGRQFETAYEAKYGEMPDTFAALGFSQMLIIGAALKAAGHNPSRESIRDALGRVQDMETVVGRGKLSMVDRIAHYDMNVLTVKNGKLVAATSH